MSYLAKKKNMMWSPFQGLFARDEAGKKANLISNDINNIAKLLLGRNAVARDLGSVESIMRALPAAEAEQALAELKSDPNWKELSQ
jgi:hypothetical protein